MKTEPFGPIAMLAPFTDLDDAISRANDSDFGLAAYAFTNSAASADRLMREIQCGIVSVNHFMGAGDSTPFGGMKDSGYGREGGAECFDGYLVSKLASHKVR
jgi:succinate-semialdehyde dehydrogenase/glutarate-semialdehyde dehydrogenase